MRSAVSLARSLVPPGVFENAGEVRLCLGLALPARHQRSELGFQTVDIEQGRQPIREDDHFHALQRRHRRFQSLAQGGAERDRAGPFVFQRIPISNRDDVPALSDTGIFDRGALDRFPGPGPGTLEDRSPHHSGSGLGRGPAASHREIANQQLMTKTSLDKSKIKILLLEGIHPSAAEKLQADGYTNIESHRKALPREELANLAADAYFVGIRSATQLDREFFENAARLTGVGCFCIGTNQVDLAAAEERGIPVFNAPFSNTRSVAELVLAEIVLLLRGIPARNAAAHRGGWLKTATGSREARGKTLGIVGYGHIGTQVGVLAESLGMQVVFHDIETRLALGNARPAPTLAALLEVADVVTLHVPATAGRRRVCPRDHRDGPRLRPGSPGGAAAGRRGGRAAPQYQC